MNKLICTCGIMLALCSCQTTPKPLGPAKPAKPAKAALSEDEQKAAQKAKAYIEKMKADDDLYCGEGMVKIEPGQLDKASAAAIEQAREELSKAIKVRVMSSFYELTKLEKGTLKTEVKSKVASFADVVLGGSKVKRFFYVPKPDYCTALAWISKKAYRDQVEKEIEKSMDLVAGPVREGLNAEAKRNYAPALRELVEAHRMLDMLFPKLTFHRDLDGDEQLDDARAYIDARLSDLLSRIQIRPSSPIIKFNLKGEPLGKPGVRASYVADGSERYPVLGLQLKATTEPAGGQFDSDRSVTAADGAAEIKLRRVGGQQKSVTLRVELAEDLPEGKGFTRPFCTIGLQRLPLVCLALASEGAECPAPPARMGEELRSILTQNGFEVLGLRLQRARICDQDVQAARAKTADYLLAATVGCRTGDDEGLHYVEAYASVTLRDLESGADVITMEVPCQRRYDENQQAAAASLVKTQVDALVVRMKVAVRLVALKRDPADRLAYIQQQQQAIAALANGAQEKLKAQRYAAALDDLLRGLRKLDALMPRATFQARIGNAKADVRAWLRRELRSLVQSIQIRPESAIWTFDQNGDLKLDPSVIARMGDSPADGLPLEATIAKGRGSIEPKAVADSNGLARIFVRRITQPCKEAVVVVRIDRAIPTELRRPPCRLLLRRVKVVACEIPEGFDVGKIEETLRSVGLVPVAAGDAAADADYRLTITTQAAKPKEDDGIFFTTVSATVEMISVQDARKEKLLAFTVGPDKGYGTKPETAVADAMVRVRKKLPDALATAVNNSKALALPKAGQR